MMADQSLRIVADCADGPDKTGYGLQLGGMIWMVGEKEVVERFKKAIEDYAKDFCTKAINS